MTDVTTPRASRPLEIPADFPNPHRLGGMDLFRHVLGGPSASTFYRWLAEGKIRAPIKLGHHNKWSETYIAEVAANGVG